MVDARKGLNFVGGVVTVESYETAESAIDLLILFVFFFIIEIGSSR